MKSKFSGFFALTPAEIEEIWNDALFVFDTSILLGFYRYSDKTRSEFFSILQAQQERCWLPFHSANEYFRNRLPVIGQQADSYQEILSSLEEIEETFKNSKKHPFISETLLEGLCSNFSQVRCELETSKAKHLDRILNDEILTNLNGIFSDRIGTEFLQSELEAIFSEGEERYSKLIPPGYKDSKKKSNHGNGNEYGDLIIWKEILKKASDSSSSIIFVSDDQKEDWWQSFRGKTIGPRPELFEEFRSIAGANFHMYSSDRFLQFSKKYLGANVSSSSISEAKQKKPSNIPEENHLIGPEAVAQRITDFETLRQSGDADTANLFERLAATQKQYELAKSKIKAIEHLLKKSGWRSNDCALETMSALQREASLLKFEDSLLLKAIRELDGNKGKNLSAIERLMMDYSEENFDEEDDIPF